MRVEVKSVTRRFGRLTALDGLSLDLASGAKVALIGPNGSGKSTLSRILAGMLSYEGEVLIDGLSLSTDRQRLAERIVYVAQAAPQLGATVGEVVQAIASVRRLERAKIAAIADRLEFDLEQVAPKSVRSLSGGMKQKLLLSLAFAAEAGLILMDEPTASLDAKSRTAFYRLVEERARTATLVLCSHRLEEVRHLVDHVVALQDGKLAWQGPLSEYLRHASHSLIEVRARGNETSAWLANRGFHAGGSGDWARVVDQAGSLPLLRDLLSGLDGKLEGVQMRDLDAIDAAAAAGRRPDSSELPTGGPR